MSSQSASAPHPAGASTTDISALLVPYILAGVVLGVLEGVRLGVTRVGLFATTVVVFAFTGLAIAAVSVGGSRLLAALLQRVLARRSARPWLSALVVAAPSLLLTWPVSSSLFDGAYAHTLPGARVWPILLPVVALAAITAAIVVGTRLVATAGGRRFVIVALVATTAALELGNRHVLRLGYETPHIGVAIAAIVLGGIAARLVLQASPRASRLPRIVPRAIIAVTAIAAVLAAFVGLRASSDRLQLAVAGDDSRHLVHLWRSILDVDRDGYSALLGGGDCDDFDSSRHPGAFDVPGDGIDQDCDGVDPIKPAPHARVPPPRPNAPTPAQPARTDLASWRATPAVHDVLARAATMNVVIISVDALRLDLLAPGAIGREDFPRLTALLDQSVWFTRAISPAAGTDVSLSTLLTGRFDPYQPVDTTLPEAMKASGRRTTAAIPGEVLRYVGDTLIGRGQDHLATVFTDWAVADVGDHVSASTTTYEALKAFDAAGAQPSFVWAHFFDVHEHHQIDVPPELMLAVRDLGGGTQQHRYRALLLAIDREVGHLLDELESRHLADHTIIVFASDHGEGLGDDPRLPDTHGQVAYATLTRVPFAIRVPGVRGGQRIDAATLVDLAPTLLDLIGMPTAISPLDGTDLVPALLDAPPELRALGRAIAVHEEQQWAVVEWPYQLLVRPADSTVELYDLDHDPDEHDDLSGRKPEVVARLRARYAEFPQVNVDRTSAGRQWREQQAQPPPRHAPS
jgi:arylsulfatase A-like enzyme